MNQVKPTVSVIIPAYNAQSTLGECLNALFHQTYPKDGYEVIVVDDGSTDGTQSIALSYQEVHLFRQEQKGPASARNLGALQAEGELLLFTDADCVPSANWIEKMMAPLQDSGIVGVKGTYSNRQKSLIARFVQIEYEDKYEHMLKDRYIDFIDTYSAGYRRDVFLQNNGFDISYTTACVEDQEFSFRLAAQGYKMVFVVDARVEHLRHASSLKDYFRKKFKIGYWKVRVHQRHPHKLIRDSHTPQQLKLQILAAAFFMILGGLSIFLPAAVYLLYLAGLLFLTASFSFIRKAWYKDKIVALGSPVLLVVRAVALGMGLVFGLLTVKFQTEKQAPQPGKI